MRKPRSKRYLIKAYYIHNLTEHAFYCKENKIRNITNEMGMSQPMSNGERIIETDSKLNFEIEYEVRIGNETLGIYNINQIVDNSDLNSMRGNPKYITTLMVK